MSERQHVALTRCYFCGEPDRIMLATRYYRTKQGMEPSHDLGPMHDKIIDMKPCQECADWMKQGIILIGIDSTKSDPNRMKEEMPNPWRTGTFSVIKEEAFCRIFHGELVELAKKCRFAFVEYKVLERLGLPVREEGNRKESGDDNQETLGSEEVGGGSQP